MTSRDQKPQVEIPEHLTDPSTKKKYERGRFLGKGGFAKCYELKDLASGEIVAGKIVPKSLLTKSHQKEKMSQEIRLHKGFNNIYVVKLFSYFEDPNFVYIILELCRRRSLMELHKRRKAITEPETRRTRSFTGISNLATYSSTTPWRSRLATLGWRLKWIMTEKGRKRFVELPTTSHLKSWARKATAMRWTCGVSAASSTRSWWENQTLKDTYTRIKKNEYHIPSRVGPLARNLIAKLLQHEPSRRPSVADALKDDFMTMGYLPPRLPVSCLTMAPRFDTKNNESLIARRNPLLEVNNDRGLQGQGAVKNEALRSESGPSDCYLSELHKQLAQLVASKPGSRPAAMEDEAEDPKVQPIVWVSKWVDYSDKYGFGYALNDESIGVVFNDLTKLLLLADGLNIHYIDYGSGEHYYTLNEFPSSVEKKVKLLNYFRNYMKEHLLKAGANMEVKEEDQLSRIPALKTWFRTSRAVVMHLTNGTIQINFFKDHTKIILCPLLGAVTYIDETRKNRTFRFDLLEKFGCSPELSSRLIYAYDKVDTMVNSKSGTARSHSVKSN